MYRDEDLVLTLRAVETEELNRLRKRLEGSLLAFTEYFWPLIEGGHPFKRNWHHGVLSEHLQAVSAGQILNALFNVPPGTSKSSLTSVMWPAWEWAKNPALRWFTASYSEPLALRDAQLCRKIVTSSEFQKLWPNFRISKGQDEKRKYETTAGGWRLTTTVGGRGTGEHPHRKIIDDPHNVKQSESDVERQAALDWYDGTLASRGLIFNAPTVLIMQRLHEKDLTGHIMGMEDYDQWAHVILPMHHEKARVMTMPRKWLEWDDPRKTEGALLWPDVFTKAKVETLTIRLGKYKTAGQLQQRPAPEGGGIIAVDKIRLWPAASPLPIFTHIIQSYDTAYTERTENDPTACSVWGLFGHTEGGRPKYGAMLLDYWSEHLSYPKLRQRAVDDWRATYGGEPKDPANKPRRPDKALIEEKGSGISLIQDLRIANVPISPFNPGHADKTARAHMASPQIEVGQVWVLESRKTPDQAVAWAKPLLEQMEYFPNGEHDDGVDTWSQAMIYFTRTGMLPLDAVLEDADNDRDYYNERKMRTNPYG